MVIYYQNENDPPDHAWRWKYVADGHIISASDRSFKTRRAAMDDWNQVNRVVNRLERRS